MGAGTPPLLSVVTVCRNAIDTIVPTLESVISQKTDQIEYVVIDGASTDGTREILKSYLGGIDVLVSEPDSGIYDAINKGIEVSRAPLVGLIHAGDKYLANVLDLVLRRHLDNPESILYGAITTSLGGRFTGAYAYPHDDLPNRMIPHPATFVPRSVYAQHGRYDTSYRIAADYHAFLRYYRSGVSFVWLDTIVCNFDQSGTSSTSTLTRTETSRVRIEFGYEKPSRPTSLLRQRLGRVYDALVGLVRPNR